MSMDGESFGKLTVPQNLDSMFAANQAGLVQYLGSDRGLVQASKLFQVYDGVFLPEDIGESALGNSAMQRHLAAFKAADHARTAARTLALMTSGGGFTHA